MSKKVLFFILLSISTIIIMSTVIIVSLKIKDNLTENLIKQSISNQETTANESSSLIQSEIVHFKEKLQIISKIPEIKNGNTDVCNSKLQEAFSIVKSNVGNLGRIDSQGIFKCSLNKSLIGIKGETLGSYIKDIFEDPEHKAVMSRAILPPGANSYVVAIHIPIFDEKNNFIGTLGGAIYFDQLEEKYLDKITYSKNGIVVLFDDDGTLLFHPKKELIGKKIGDPEISKSISPPDTYNLIHQTALNVGKGTAEYSFEGLTKVGVYRSFEVFPGRKWIVLTNTPKAEISSYVLSSGINNLFTTLITVVITITLLTLVIFLLVMYTSLFAPIDKLTQAIRKVITGDLTTHVEFKGNDEIGKLGRLFNEMTTTLKNSYNLLESQVAKRTAELSRANLELQKRVLQEQGTVEKSQSETKNYKDINEYMIGREVRMAELKKEIEELKIKLQEKENTQPV